MPCVVKSSDVRPFENAGIRWQARMTKDGSRNPKAWASVSGTNPTLGSLVALNPYLCPGTTPRV